MKDVFEQNEIQMIKEKIYFWKKNVKNNLTITKK